MGSRISSTRVAIVAFVLVPLVLAGCTTIGYPSPGESVTPGDPFAAGVFAHPKGVNLPPDVPITGEGELRIRMSAPGTAWVDPTATSVVVEASIDNGVAQTFVLFAGGEPYTYTGFTGPISTGLHDLTVSVRPDLSPTTTPTVRVHNIDLTVVPTTDPSHAAIAHAPVLYGRSVSAHSDTPLFQFVDDDPASGGGRRLTYTTTWSNEDAGTGIIPWLLWGGYGRTTDIETTAIVNLDAAGTVTSTTFQTCAACPPDYPENQVGLDHSYETFAGTYFGGHPVLRVATGNNVLEDTGTTPFRFHQGLVAGPLPGETRESAMDPFAIGYRVMGEELQREQAGYNTSALSSAAGDARQYAVVDLDTSPVGTRAVNVELQVAGDPRWYQSDFGNGAAFYTGGHSRTAVKLPIDWHGKAITGVRVRLYPTTPAPVTPPTITVHSLRVLEITSTYATRYVSVPTPLVVVNP